RRRKWAFFVAHAAQALAQCLEVIKPRLVNFGMMAAQDDPVLVIAEDAALELAGYGHEYLSASAEHPPRPKDLVRRPYSGLRLALRLAYLDHLMASAPMVRTVRGAALCCHEQPPHSNDESTFGVIGKLGWSGHITMRAHRRGHEREQTACEANGICEVTRTMLAFIHDRPEQKHGRECRQG